MKDFQAAVISGLTTDTYIVPVAGSYYLGVQASVNFGSGLVITLSQSGSLSESAVTPPTSSQQEEVSIQHQFRNCQVGDVLTVALTSSAPIDQPPNLIKATINLRAGY